MVGDTTKICITIVGNKLDLERHGRAVSIQEAQKYAESVGATFMEVSAKTGKGVEDVFVELTRNMLDTVKKPSHRSSRSSSLASASISFGKSTNCADERIDLSQKVSDYEPNRCC